jgi:hypothetical protein
MRLPVSRNAAEKASRIRASRPPDFPHDLTAATPKG